MTRTSNPADELFERERPRLLGLAYRLLGSVTDAEDVVQETWMRYRRHETELECAEAWLTTVCGRIGLDHLRARQRLQVTYVGPWLPEPIAERVPPRIDEDPSAIAELSDSLTTSFLVVLEHLRPEERLAVLMVDVFGEPFAAVAEALGKSEAACRQLASRARRKLRDATAPRPTVSDAAAVGVARRLVEAVLLGDMAAVCSLLSPDVVMVSDGGASTHAARRPVVRPDRVSRFLVNTARRGPSWAKDLSYSEIVLNGSPGFLGRDAAGLPVVAQCFDIVDGLVVRIHTFANPDKLTAIDRTLDLR